MVECFVTGGHQKGGGLGSVVAYQQWEKGGQRGATDMRQQPSYMRCWKSPS
jgi:hypothetical protein